MSRVILLAAFLFWTGTFDLQARGKPWVTLQGCQYLIKRANDGDSFHVSVGGKEYIFRLYFVDAPETDREFPERVQEQGKYFKMSMEQTLQLGELAKNYTREKLSQPFIVRTCWEDAMGRSRLRRSYAFVQTNNGDLGEQLVENGMARVHGEGARPAGLDSIGAEWTKLRDLEKKAKEEKVGAWGAKEGRIANRATNPQSTRGVDPFETFFHSEQAVVPPPENAGVSSFAAAPAATPFDPQTGIRATKLDVNTASETELENIPGIGPGLARRIIEARPFKNADDLQRVKGIGHGKKYGEIRPYFK